MIVRVFALGALAFMLAGCTTYDKQISAVRENYIAGDFDAALAKTQKKQKDSGNDALIWKLEHATILRAAGRIDESVAAFDDAYDLYMENLDAAKIRLLRGGAELLTTPANAPYWGTGYDGIMINTYQALNALQRGEIERARVDLVRAYNLQQEVVAMNASRIEKEQEEAAKDANVASAVESGKGITSGVEQMAEIRAELGVYADYVNPFTVWLDALYHATQGLDASDMERARRSFERASTFAPRNATVREDFGRITNGQRIASGVYVIFETGMAPRLQEVSFRLPLLIQHVPYIGLSYPKLVLDPTYVRELGVRAEGRTVTTERMASMDAIIAREFDGNFPGILTKAIASAVLKAVAAAVANEAAKQSDSGLLQLGTFVGTMAYQIATDVADTRSWQTLPKEFHIAKIAMPQDRTLQLLSPNGTWAHPVKLIDGDIIVVYAKAIYTIQDMTINQFKLR
ncbi:MAG: hypothetical protein FWF84_05240 [Kiritimatiellaeota bacterium]|nr:hypothetical protein [Kiritimatiellota bacterium]